MLSSRISNRLRWRRPSLKELAPWLVAAVLFCGYIIHVMESDTVKSLGASTSIQLRRGPFTVYAFPSRKPETTALILFGSGDWGWGDWEDSAAYDLSAAGYAVMGIDCMKYGQTDYDLDILQSDYSKIAQTARTSFGLTSQPLIVGGFSMGAEQAVPVAGGPHPPPGIVGLLLVSPEKRGRYGLRGSDQMDIPPTGPGTFAMEDFAPALGALRIVQWHAELDFTDSAAWLSTLKAPHHEFVFPHVLHNYDYGCVEFRRQLVKSVHWILDPTPQNAADVQAQD